MYSCSTCNSGHSTSMQLNSWPFYNIRCSLHWSYALRFPKGTAATQNDWGPVRPRNLLWLRVSLPANRNRKLPQVTWPTNYLNALRWKEKKKSFRNPTRIEAKWESIVFLQRRKAIDNNTYTNWLAYLVSVNDIHIFSVPIECWSYSLWANAYVYNASTSHVI